MEFVNPLQWARWLVEFFRAWLLAVPWRDAPKAIPAILLMLVMAIVGTIAMTGGAGWRNRLLNNQLAVAFDMDDYSTAEVVIRRQLDADPNNGDLLYRLAVVRDAQSHVEEAKEILRYLALERRHLDAAKWLLEKDFIGKQWGSLTSERREEFGQILELITQQERENLKVLRLYAEYLIASEKFSSAIPVLKKLSQTDPMRALQAAALSRKLGDFDGADVLAERALEDVNKMSNDDPTNSTLALAVAQNQLFLKRYGDAVRTLDSAIKVAKTPAEKNLLSQAMGDAIVAWIAFIEEAPNATVQERVRILKMLRAALNYAPNNPRVVTLVADQVLGTLNDDEPSIAEIRDGLLASLVDGKSPGIAHFIKGTSALMSDDIANAMLHLDLAREMMPQSSAVLNNLAVAMALQKDPDLDKALKLSNAAIEQTPQPTPHFYETRGQILYRMGSFMAAIPDLERTLAAPSLATKAHEMLAVCYDRVGDKVLANQHRAAAKQTPQESDPE
ncbi:tetratricopeptide repeat protein [Stieleria varia]|uniref:Anaphase-promoting complex, cyclosome, subunit 3 n=1 Tax=Stieleria varia TaxID=2528005 RepID=A0A5C6B080_9BACT|nr:tetratricopeptide repeat protein [Stieleria varia]TWU04859.1 Anaphase-promoting complex, cyclosome, subunit 3 [Stieleria varia]